MFPAPTTTASCVPACWTATISSAIAVTVVGRSRTRGPRGAPPGELRSGDELRVRTRCVRLARPDRLVVTNPRRRCARTSHRCAGLRRACPTVFDGSWIHACSTRAPPGMAAKSACSACRRRSSHALLRLRLHLVRVLEDRALRGQHVSRHVVARRPLGRSERDVHRELTRELLRAASSSTRTPILFAGGCA